MEQSTTPNNGNGSALFRTEQLLEGLYSRLNVLQLAVSHGDNAEYLEDIATEIRAVLGKIETNLDKIEQYCRSAAVVAEPILETAKGLVLDSALVGEIFNTEGTEMIREEFIRDMIAAWGEVYMKS